MKKLYKIRIDYRTWPNKK